MKKIISFFFLLITFSLTSLSAEKPADAITLNNPNPSLRESTDLAEWFVKQHSRDYQGHFKSAYYRVESCHCSPCKNRPDKDAYYVKGLRSDDKDAVIEHDGVRSKYLKNKDEFITFAYAKEWQYLKDDIIAACQDASPATMLRFEGFAFLQVAGRGTASSAAGQLKDAINGSTFASGNVTGLPEDWRFQFTDPIPTAGPTTFSTYRYLTTYRKLINAECYADKYLASAINDLRVMSQQIGILSDGIVKTHQQFICHLVEFLFYSKSEEAKTRNQEFVKEACVLYKGILSQNPSRALELRGTLSPNKLKDQYPFSSKDSGEDHVKNLQYIAHQIEQAPVDFSLFANPIEAVAQLQIFKDKFVASLQIKHNYIFELNQAFRD